MKRRDHDGVPPVYCRANPLESKNILHCENMMP